MTTATIPKMIVTGPRSAAFEAGAYWVGDPCYPFPNDGPHSERWMELLRSCAFFDPNPKDGDVERWGPFTGEPGAVGQVTVDGVAYPVAAFGTAYGDGAYLGSDGFEYGVDAGLIGMVPVALVEALGNDAEYVARLGKVYTFATGGTFERDDDGTFTIRSGGTVAVTIETGDPKCSTCSRTLDGDGCCERCDPTCSNCGSHGCSGAFYGRCDEDDEDDD